MTEAALEQAYAYCRQLAISHYENFPVASLLLPRHLRQPISVIYAFARTADDFADEGNASQAVRLEQLNAFSTALRQVEQDNYQGQDPIFIALSDIIKHYQLPVQLFDDLLTAFKQDVIKSRYANFEEVLNYCRFSANPVGRLLLHLQGQPSEQQLAQSDAICSALQLINFYQDIEQDYREQDRIYIPQDELAEAGLHESALLHPDTQKIAPLLRSLYQRTAELMQQGYPLGMTLSGRLGWEIRAMTLGGITTLDFLARQTDKALLGRPRLDRSDLIIIMLKSASARLFMQTASQRLDSALYAKNDRGAVPY